MPAAVLFEMDGTLTKPLLNFSRLKAEIGIGNRPILEAMAEMRPDERNRAEAILARHEGLAAQLSTLNPGCHEVLAWLEARGVRTALITRNSRSSVRTVLGVHRLPIDVLVTRDDAPPKPDPEPLYQACRRLEVDPATTWMVGDGEFDVRAGLNAGVRTVWLNHGRRRLFPETPWREVADLWEMIGLLEACGRA